MKLFATFLFILLFVLSCSATEFGGNVPIGSSKDKDDEPGESILTPGDKTEMYDKNGNIITGEDVEFYYDEDGVMIAGDAYEVPGEEVELVGIGFAMGNHDDWNDGAVCFMATNADISIDGRKIRANKDVTLTVKLSGHSYPGPTVRVYRIKLDGTKEVLLEKTFTYNKSAPGKYEEDIEFKKGEELFSEGVSGGGTYKQDDPEWARITADNCDDYPDAN